MRVSVVAVPPTGVKTTVIVTFRGRFGARRGLSLTLIERAPLTLPVRRADAAR